MANALILAVHPDLSGESKANRALIDAVKDLENVTVHDLYKEYPDFKIDVEREQQLLVQYDVIVMQFPFYWFSSPALLKEWTDRVFTTDFAFEDAHMLEGKKFLVSVTAGVGEETYKEGGVLVEDFLNTFEATAEDIKVHYQKPFIIHNAMAISDEELAAQAAQYRKYLVELMA